MGECKCLLSVSDDIVYLFTYQECLIYLFSHIKYIQIQLHTQEHIPCTKAAKKGEKSIYFIHTKNFKKLDPCLLSLFLKKLCCLVMKIRRCPIYLQQSPSSFLLVIDISNQNFSIWHLKNIIGQIEKVTFRNDIHIWVWIWVIIIGCE